MEDRINLEHSIEYIYEELRVLIRKFSVPEIHLPRLKTFYAKNGGFNNHTQLEGLANFIDPIITEQSIETENTITQSRILDRNKTKHETAISKFQDLESSMRQLQRDMRKMSHEDYVVELRSFYSETSVLIKNYCTDSVFFESKLTALITGNSKQAKDMQLVDSILLLQSIIRDLEIQQEKYENRVSDLELENRILIEASHKINRESELLSVSAKELGEKFGTKAKELVTDVRKTDFDRTRLYFYILVFVFGTYLNFSIPFLLSNFNWVPFVCIEVALLVTTIVTFKKHVPEYVQFIINFIMALVAIFISLKG